MIVPGYLPLPAFRNGTFLLQLKLQGVDLTGYNFKMQIRSEPGAPDPALITLNTVTDNTTGVKLIGVNTDSGVTTSTIQLHITQANLATAMAGLVPTTEIFSLAWDIIFTPPSGEPYVWLYGPFTLNPGVTA